MTTMNEQECISIIKLLESLGVGVRKISNDIIETYMLECDTYAYIGGAHHFSGYASIIMILMNSLHLSYFKDNSQKLYCAKNPYYGCKSLEEALVKADLLCDGRALK